MVHGFVGFNHEGHEDHEEHEDHEAMLNRSDAPMDFVLFVFFVVFLQVCNWR